MNMGFGPGAAGRPAIRAGLLTAAIFASAFLGFELRGPAAQAAERVAPAAEVHAPAAAPTASYADLVSRVAPSIVTVRAERVVKPVSHELVPDDPWLRRFFGPEFRESPLRPHRQGGLGSGVIVSEDGYVLTNHHVVDHAQHVVVDLADRRSFDAKVVGSDAASDLAVLKIDAKGLTPLPLGDSNAVRAGDVVLAFGNPLGIGQTVTMGILSAKGRATGLGDGTFEDFLQTDAPINQGNSGGALVNLRGELIGINSQIMSPSGGNIGIGFAIPAAMAENVMQQLIHGGKVHRGLLGVSVQSVTSDMAKSLSLSKVQGALVGDVTPGSPAAKAGIQRGDVILALDGSDVLDSNSLRNRISSVKPGAEVALTVLRDGHERTVKASLVELGDSKTADAGEAGGAEGERLGLSVRPVSDQEARELGLEGRKGLLVADVDAEGPAAEAGFRPGDVIQTVDGKPVADAGALRSAVKAAGDRPALVLIGRNGTSLFLTLENRG